MNGYTQQFEFESEENPDRKIMGITQGQFILDGETIFLQTRAGDRFNLDRVGICSTAFNDKDGILRFPKPFIYDSDGNLTQQGDLLIIAFENGDIFNPVVLSSIIPVSKNDFFHSYNQSDYQKKKARWKTDQATIEYQDDGQGEIQLDVSAQDGGTGNITINLTGNSDAGNIIINTTGNVTLNSSATATVKGDSKVIVDSPLIELGKDATEAVIKGNVWATFYAAHVHPTGMGPSGPPTNAATVNTVLSTRNKTL